MLLPLIVEHQSPLTTEIHLLSAIPASLLATGNLFLKPGAVFDDALFRRGTSSTGSIEIITVGVQSPYLFICVNVSSAVHSISHPPSIRVGGGVSVGWDLHNPALRHTARLEFVLLKLAVVSLFMMMLHYDSE
ncbi:hypothetical protein OIU85_016822 [Salix viminalis]|uniref:Uncharacterized protein n=1 Tax=Salix viminalis TaxID=40686 RepID=A0A9Q0V602_SALVM|nr:hypothetical protein OIU85_016822 [Salix viminalis]